MSRLKTGGYLRKKEEVGQVLNCLPEENERKEVLGSEMLGEGRSVYAFDTPCSRSSVLLARPKDVVLCDANRPIPDRYIEYLESIGFGAYQYFTVPSGEGTLCERALRDRTLCRNLSYLQQKDGKALVLKPDTPKPDSQLFANEMAMAYFFGSSSEDVAKLSSRSEVRSILARSDLKLPITDGMLCEGGIAIRHFAEQFLNAGHKIVIKANLVNGAGGTGFTHINTKKDKEGKFEQLENYLQSVSFDSEVIVERWYRTPRPSPSALVRVSQDGLGRPVVKVIQLADQILTKLGEWVGNTIPSHLSPQERGHCKRLARKLGYYVADKFKYRGIFGLNFLMVADEVAKKDVPIIADANFCFVESAFLDRVVRAKKHKGVANCSILNGSNGTKCDYAVVQEIISRLSIKPGDYVIPHNIRSFANDEGALIILAKTEKDVAIYQGTVLHELQRRKYGGEPPRSLSRRCVN